ncbi:unnamed protein product, partial [Prorocentrum cordatum]
ARSLAQRSQQALAAIDTQQVLAVEHRYRLASEASEEVQRRQTVRLRRVEEAVEEMLHRIAALEEGLHAGSAARPAAAGPELEARVEALERRQDEAECALDALAQARDAGEGAAPQAAEAAERSIANLERRTSASQQEFSAALASLRVKVDGQLRRTDALAERLESAHEPALEALRAEVAQGTMFKNTYQSGFLSVLYSIGSKPLQIWDKKVRNGHIKRLTDADIQSSVLEIMGTNVSTTFITCPADADKTLGIKLPFLVMIIKNLKKYFTFEVTVLDDKDVRRRFRASNYQSTTRVKPFICTMPMRLDEGWNQIQFNLSTPRGSAGFTRRAYGTNYIETLRLQLHANCRIRRIYFSDRLYSEEELPPEFKLFLPVAKKGGTDAGAAAGGATAAA